MSTIRYTSGGNYNPSNYHAANTTDQVIDTVEYNRFGENEFDVHVAGTSGPTGLPQTNFQTDGIYADLSDNVAAVNMTGGGKGDVLIGGPGNDTINGGSGDDVLEGGAGGDDLQGGGGFNTVSFAHADPATGVFVDQLGLMGNQGDAQGDTYTDIQAFIGSAGDDIFGLTGTYTVEGGAGADNIFNFGTGVITASYTHSSAGVQVNLDAGTASGGDAQGDTLSSVANLVGSAHDDTLIGDANDNFLTGLAGRDVIFGGDGNDTIVGGAGADRVFGGSGADTFVFDSLGDIARGLLSGSGGNNGNRQPGLNRDVIRDFSGAEGAAQGDHIDLSSIATFTFETGHGFAAGGSASIYVTDAKHGFQVVHGDINGDGVADFTLRVLADGILTGADFDPGNQPAAHPITSAFHPEAMIDTHPAFAGGMHVMEHMAIA